MIADIIIIGTGLAGVYTALNLDSNLNVLLITKGKFEDCNSYLAQGGIAATLDNDYSSHIKDTLEIGHHYNNNLALELLVKNSSKEISTLEKLNVQFDKINEDYDLTMEGGHSKRRILHIKDQTGKSIMDSLKKEILKRANIKLMEDTYLCDLIIDDKQCKGIKIIKDNKCFSLYSTFTVLATGGVGGIYYNTTNIKNLYGDGIAIASRHSIDIANMDLIQFHPTAFYDDKKRDTFLISEAVRGEGAYLKNIYNERFMYRYHSDKELAGRDIVSKSIYTEMQLTNSPFVYLDMTHLSNNYIINRFPYIYKKCLEKGFDITKDLIPVSPVQHYTIGGIKVDLWGRTNLKNLYACGECSNTGIHGANRLASNSLLECLVFGSRIANHINDCFEVSITKGIIETDIRNDYNLEFFNILQQEIQDIMSQSCWIVRNKKSLINALNKLKNIYEHFFNNKSLLNGLSIEYYDTLNMLCSSLIIIQQSLNRSESIGCFVLEESVDIE